jgi:predicted ribosomally synthesized peptide with SipW-like signal peptide
MTDGTLELTRRKILAAASAAGIAGAAAGFGTSALFTDTESFTNNTITAGTTNLIAEAEVVDVSSGLQNNGSVVLEDADSDGGTDSTVLEADGTVLAGLTVSDMKPGDSFIIRVTVEVEDNPMYVAATVANADDSEGINTEPENSTQSGGTDPDTGGDAVGDGSGDDAGDLDNELLVTFGYDGDQTSGGSADRTLDASSITPDPGLGFDGSSSATATSFIGALQGDGLVYRGQASGTASPPGGHADASGSPTRIGGDVSASNVDREQVTHFIKFELPASVGNEVQGDSFSFDLGFEAEQVRNNPDPLGTGGGGGGGGPTQITSPGLQNNGFGTALDSGSPVVSGEPGVNSDEGRAWILPDSGGSVTQGAKLTASQPGDRVGETVAVDGNTAVVGAPGTNSGAGEVYVYNKSGGSWSNSPDFALTNADNKTGFDENSVPEFDPDPSFTTPFGSVVDIDGDVIVAGARPSNFNLVGYNAFERSSDPSTSDWVWIDFFVDLQKFTDVATDNGVGLLINSDPGFQVFRIFPTEPSPPFTRFGPGQSNSVSSISGFGAQGDISSGTVFIGADDKVLVYEQTGTQTLLGGGQIPTYNNSPTVVLSPSSGATGVGFGTKSLAAEGNAVAIGAPTEGSGGVTYLYEKTGGSWGQTKRITAPSGASNFGRGLALSSSTLYVGASTSGGGSVYTYPI